MCKVLRTSGISYPSAIIVTVKIFGIYIQKRKKTPPLLSLSLPLTRLIRQTQRSNAWPFWKFRRP